MSRLLLSLLFCLLSFASIAQINVSAALDTTNMQIGDNVTLRLEANMPIEAVLKKIDMTVFEKVLPIGGLVDSTDLNPGEFEIREPGDWVKGENAEAAQYKRALQFTFFNEGEYLIPAVAFTIEHKGRSKIYRTNPLAIQVILPIPDTLNTTQQQELAPNKGIAPEGMWFRDLALPLFIGAFILIALGSLFYYLFVRKPEVKEVEIVIRRQAHEIAFESLHQLKAKSLWQKGKLKEYHSELTHIVREYLENRYDIQALESTSDEIVRDLKNSEVPKEFMDKLRTLFQGADLVKFAKATPPEEIHERMMTVASEFVQQTKKHIDFDAEQADLSES